MSAWTCQDSRQKKNLGEAKCPWSVGWIDPDGDRRSKKIGSKSMADKFARKIEGQLAAGVYQDESRKTWADFRREYEEKIASAMEPGSRQQTSMALAHFERLTNPGRLSAVKTQTIDRHISRRRLERGLKRGSTVSPATINKELRHIKATLRVAHEWGYLPKMPKVRKLTEPVKLIRYVTADHFAAIYQAADVAVRPEGQPHSPADWWRALLTFTYMTGWRVSEPLAVRWDDVSLDEGTAITRHADNKGKRDELAPLHPIVVEHLRPLVDASIDNPLVFYWPHNGKGLWTQFGRIQRAAGIHLPCREDHEHTPSCHVYGFHDLRRAVRYRQRGNALSGRPAGSDAAQELSDHPTLHQHGPAGAPVGRQALRAGGPEESELSVS